MKKIRFVLFVCLFNGLLQAGYSQENTYKALPDSFFTVMRTEGTDAAIDYIFRTNKYLRLKLANNLKIKNELNNVVKLLGKYYNAEFIKAEELAPSYVKLFYLAKYDRQPLLFIFTMYKPEKDWRIQQLKFTEKITDFLEKQPSEQSGTKGK